MVTPKHTYFYSLFVKNNLTLKQFWNYENLIQIRILKVRVSQLENSKLFHPFQKIFWTSLSVLALTKMLNSATLTFNQCPQMCYTITKLVNWIIELMLKYYGSFFIIHEEILLHKWLSPQNHPGSLSVPH